MALKAEKKILRKVMNSKLRSLSSSNIQDQSRVITATVLALPSFIRSKSVSCYLSMPSGEVDTSSLVREILRRGKTLFVPKIDTATDGRMEFLQVYDEEDLNSLPSGVWGIKEPNHTWNGHPRASAIEAGLDMVLLPGLAFDRSFSRLGHGKGYYDKFVSAYCEARRSPPLLGSPIFIPRTEVDCGLQLQLSLKEQLLDSKAVPVGDHDWKMACIVTEEGELSDPDT
ncbi:hypothetical protein C8J57DRAFT_1066677 [Mycena rebaudengoi]|nr:hypothetical protein C8J57DRAFT_1066677 [Mycena rebaudengoi]